MVDQVVLHERRDEVVPVVVAFMAPQLQRVPDFFGSLFKQVRMQLRLQKLIRQSLINQDRCFMRRILHPRHQLSRIMIRPLPLIRPQVT